MIAPGGITTVSKLEIEIKSILGSSGVNIVLGGSSLRSYEGALETIVDALNMNQTVILV